MRNPPRKKCTLTLSKSYVQEFAFCAGDKSLPIFSNIHSLTQRNKIITAKPIGSMSQKVKQISRNLRTIEFKIDQVLDSIIRIHRGPLKYSYVMIALLSHVILVKNPDLSQKKFMDLAKKTLEKIPWQATGFKLCLAIFLNNLRVSLFSIKYEGISKLTSLFFQRMIRKLVQKKVALFFKVILYGEIYYVPVFVGTRD